MQLRSRNLLSTSGKPSRLKGEHGDDNRLLDVQIKQEITEKLGSSLRVAPVVADPFLNRDYCYFCKVCNVEMSSLKAIWKHRKKLHPDLVRRRKLIKYIHREPNVNDPNCGI